MTPTQKNKLIFLLIVLVFAAPILISLGLHFFTDINQTAKKANLGQLIKPARAITISSFSDSLDHEKTISLKGKWTMVYWAQGACDDPCRQAIYTMRQVRLTTGKHAKRIQRLLLVDDISPELQQFLKDYSGQWLSLNHTPAAQKIINTLQPELIQDAFYIIDPLGHFMMIYLPPVDPYHIIKDLRKLMKTSRIG